MRLARSRCYSLMGDPVRGYEDIARSIRPESGDVLELSRFYGALACNSTNSGVQSSILPERCVPLEAYQMRLLYMI